MKSLILEYVRMLVHFFSWVNKRKEVLNNTTTKNISEYLSTDSRVFGAINSLTSTKQMASTSLLEICIKFENRCSTLVYAANTGYAVMYVDSIIFSLSK